jgi:hypothetical protein
MSEPSKEAMETEQWTMLRTSEFAALRARAEAAEKLASALRRIETGWTTMEADELSDIAREALAAYEQAKEVK